MAKILISSLGTGRFSKSNSSERKYDYTIYKFQNTDKTYKTPFIVEALCKCLEIDKLYLIGTSKSMWEELYYYFSNSSGQTLDEEYWDKLSDMVTNFKVGGQKLTDEDLSKVNETIDNYLKNIKADAIGGSRCFIIDYGLDEKEIWSNFDVIMQIGETLTDDDEIYLDITHAFRLIPLFLYIMIDLIRILKLKNDFKVAGLYYGMLEAIGDLGYAPIVDLSPLYNMTLWTRGAYDFLNFGNGYLLADLISKQELSDIIRNISDIVNINFIDEFKREIDRLSGLLKDTNTVDPIINYMLPYLMTFVERFKGINSSSQLQFALAKWYFENRRFAQCYICLAEAIVSRILEEYRARDSRIKWNNDSREKVKYLIHRTDFGNMDKFKDMCKIYKEISSIRNLIAHAGFADREAYKEAINKINTYIRCTESLVFKNKHLKEIPVLFPFDKLANN